MVHVSYYNCKKCLLWQKNDKFIKQCSYLYKKTFICYIKFMNMLAGKTARPTWLIFFKLRETAWHFWLLCLGMAGGIWGCFKCFEFTNSWAQYWSFCTGKQTAVNFDICSTFYTLQYTVHFVVHCKLCSTFWNFSVQCKIFPILIVEDCTLCSTLYILQYTVNFTAHCTF